MAPVTKIPRTLVVTNDFPPRIGGVQQYVFNLVAALPAGDVAVLAPNWPGWRAHDGRLPFPVHRWPATFLWPTGDLERRVLEVVRAHGAEMVVFGHGYPTPLIGPALAGAGIPYVVLTHGAEVWMARAPGIAATMRWALSQASAVTVISDYTRDALSASVPDGVALEKLTPAVDERRFRPDVDGSWIRDRHGLGDRPVVLCVSRFVPRKGQDVLINGAADLQTLLPDAAIVLVGGGPDEPKLRRLATRAPVGSVVFAGEASDAELPAYYASCDAFAMPCRSRWGGLEVEGFGIVYLEAAAAGKPVVAGRSGGAGEAVADTETGLVVEGREPKAVALAMLHVLEPDGKGRRMGQAGRARVEAEFTWQRQGVRLAEILRRAAGEVKPRLPS
jgi:phosphatidyl-myo-inositol dimannoside synthase